MLPQLSPALTGGLASGEILDVLRNLALSDSKITFSSLEGRLTEPSRDLLHEIATADEWIDGELPQQHAQACLKRLELDFKRRQVDQLRAQVKTAEREGRIQDALGWMAELSRLEREARSAGSG